MLADDGQAITAMQVYTLRAPAHMASLRLENVRRHEREVCPIPIGTARPAANGACSSPSARASMP